MKKIIFSLIIATLFLATFGASSVKAESTSYTYDFITYDNGMHGLWATDYFHSTVTITPSGGDCYDVVRTDGGTFEVLPGASSPGGDGDTKVGDGTKGTISGGLSMNICGALIDNPDLTTEDLRGYVNPTDFYAGKYFHRFFSDVTNETWKDWEWTFSTCGNGTWIDNDDTETLYGTVGPNGVMGDIKGAYISCQTIKDQCKKGGWESLINHTFKNQGACVSYVANGNSLFTFSATDSSYYNGPSGAYPIYASGPISFIWNPITHEVTGGYYTETAPANTGTTYYNLVTGGTVNGNDVYLTFSRTLPNAYGFTFTGHLSGNVLTGLLDGDYITATGN